jgi:threonine/homoserine/homoserine lactone efflux protein
MSQLAVLPFVLFCLVATGTPGPNNMINLAQGVRLGFWPALPFALGTGFGIASLLVAVALGLGAALDTLPWLTVVMRGVTFLFLVYLAWKIATAGPMRSAVETQRLGFMGGAGFQWVNPKTWAVSMTMATTYLGASSSLGDTLLAAAIFCVVSWITQPVWIAFGTALRRLLSDPRRALLINIAMAGLLLASTVPLLATGN